MSEEILIRQGAPTLAGIKTGSLFPCPCENREALLTDIRQLNRRLSPKGRACCRSAFCWGRRSFTYTAPPDCGGICGMCRRPSCCDAVPELKEVSPGHLVRCISIPEVHL